MTRRQRAHTHTHLLCKNDPFSACYFSRAMCKSWWSQIKENSLGLFAPATTRMSLAPSNARLACYSNLIIARVGTKYSLVVGVVGVACRRSGARRQASQLSWNDGIYARDQVARLLGARGIHNHTQSIFGVARCCVCCLLPLMLLHIVRKWQKDVAR